MKALFNLRKMSPNKYYFYELYREYVIEFDNEHDINRWVNEQKKKDTYFGYDGYWLKNGKDARTHFKLGNIMGAQ